MAAFISLDRLRFLLSRFRDRLWVKPLVVCLLSVAAAFGAKLADGTVLTRYVPEIAVDSINTLLSIMASSMLVIATFSVSSMVSAYASASNTATPRSFTLVVADDASQNALSTFVGAFIFSIVALIALKNDFFERAGLFILFALTVFVFGLVIVTFVRWVDRVARLGRLGSTITKVEEATAAALKRRRNTPNLGGVAAKAQTIEPPPDAMPVHSTRVGYVQYIDISTLNNWAEKNAASVTVTALPGTFIAPGRVLAYVVKDEEETSNADKNESDKTDIDHGESSEDKANENNEIDLQPVTYAFQIGRNRLFDDDPRFGLVVLSEIAGRALSPAVNDPGTAIDIIGRLLRLFTLWDESKRPDDEAPPKCQRVTVPDIAIKDMFDDAFTAIARDGAGSIEVAMRLQKALRALAMIEDEDIQNAAKQHAELALKRAKAALTIEEDYVVLEAVNGVSLSSDKNN